MRLLSLNCSGIAKLALRRDVSLPASQPLLSDGSPPQDDCDLLGAHPVNAQENHGPHPFPVSPWRCSLDPAQPVLMHSPKRVDGTFQTDKRAFFQHTSSLILSSWMLSHGA